VENNGVKLEDYGPNAGYVAELLDLYKSGSPLLDKSWKQVFGGNGASTNGSAAIDPDYILDQIKIISLIKFFRSRGHLGAQINSLHNGMKTPRRPAELNIESYHFSNPTKTFFCFGLLKDSFATAQNIFDEINRIYCSSVGYEFEHLSDPQEAEWIRAKVESGFASTKYADVDKLKFLSRLLEAEKLDQLFHTRFIGTKRFSIQGAESFAVILQSILNSSEKLKVRDISLAMAHRGRLNTLVSFAGKPLPMLAAEFEDKTEAAVKGGGDVKYHLGSTTEHVIRNHKVSFSIPCNPSHLEFVNPVGAGMIRARQDLLPQHEKSSVLYLSVHGDASFAGQGIVSEVFNFSQLPGYKSHGTIHIIINNQVGFTTYAEDSRSTNYCSDVAKGFDVPVFHVNADDPEAVARAAELALEFRQKFAKDVVLDLVCSRKYGHNEGDDPSFTQPLLYKELSKKESVATLYSKKIIQEGALTEAAFKELSEQILADLKAGIEEKPSINKESKVVADKVVAYNNVDLEDLKKVTAALIPEDSDFELHPKVKALILKRQQSLLLPKGIDWGFAEALAYGTLLLDGCSIRLSGQDSGRGTFSHRHLELHDYNTAKRVLPFDGLINQSAKKSTFEVFNSPLSEQAVMAFDYGYAVQMHDQASTKKKDSLVIWEAQFGDFGNGAQVIIDQFITSAEEKWKQNCGIVLLLPHGFEGQGPEHSSARLERFLQLCANNNMRVANLSNGAQLFHLLRKQALDSQKKPLILMTPKSMLRLPEAGSSVEELTKGAFSPILSSGDSKSAKSVILCSGKVYYSIRKAIGTEAKVVRIEQLYPWPETELKKELLKAKSIVWAQEEPRNMGAFSYVLAKFASMGIQIDYIGRPEAAGVATGSSKWHAQEEAKFFVELKSVL
jgi:2-oxoglutarate dehydrogenase E1 component